ncbi:F-actin-monooxygenase Mical isoform X10 [Zerene cesonia]|uniref:F-actin-monooxygenase Mical isoform X10 n=1 Tax=Zerene cesonia TaxID=33412 RepID=UPI0018E57AFC|nr:F-actin-monooxygenase Mical isoform X10 [Zerene cesonia]
MNRGPRVEPTPPECALAAEMFDHFCSAGTMKQILALHREICNTLNLKPNRLPDFYPKLKAKLAASWKAQALFKKFDARANHKVYNKGKMCPQTKVLIIGAGPCGLRAAIECQLLGAKVVVVEKRDRISRNNVLHLWPFVIHDLRALGAKKFFGKFCAGSIDHISIRQLQCILMKVSLLLGVEIHEGVGFEELLEPAVSANSEILGWRARVMPHEHPVSQYEFDVLIGADGKRNTLQGFKRKEFRGKLAMAITANFINRHTEQEAAVPEISGVAFIFNQKFFKDLNKMTGIDLENIVYYKDDTHYFVMTAKKHSLLDKGVLLNDYPEVSRLLSVENVNRAALMRYAQEAARFSTDGRLPLRDFALNHYGEPDVALFDFTSMYAAENASIVYERLGRRLLCQLVGDSLLEPFWPTGSGCARGFLSALDSAWAVRAWGQTPHPHPLQVIAERESIYRLLAQTTPENLHRDFGAYTLDPGTRYPNLNRTAVTPHRVTSFYDSDDPLPLDTATLPKKRRRDPEVSEEALIAWVGYQEPGIRAAASPAALYELVKRYRPDLLADLLVDQLSDDAEWPIYHVLQQEFGIPPFSANQQIRDVPEAKLRSYLTRVYYAFKGEVPHIHHESNMFDQIKQSQQKDKSIRNTAEQSISAYSYAADTDKSHSTKRKRRTVRSPQEEGKLVGGKSRMIGGGVRVAKLAAELSSTSNIATTPLPKASKPKDLMRSVGKINREDWNVKEIERKITENRLGRPEPKTAEKVPKWDREQFLGRQRKLKEGDSNDEKWGEIDETIHKIDLQLNDSGRPMPGTKKVANLATKFVKKADPTPTKSQLAKKEVSLKEKKVWRGPTSAGKQCTACGTRVFAAEGVTADGLHLHRACFRCAVCKAVLRPGSYTMERYGTRLVCLRHSGVDVPEAGTAGAARNEYKYAASTPERISIELSDGAREIDEDEWTDRNFLASETSGAGGLSDDDDSSTDEYVDVESEAEAERSGEQAVAPPPAHSNIYFSDDSFGYDDYSDDGAESSGGESCSRMREAREARRREVPAHAPPPSDSSEIESDEESESSDEEVSSATEVSTDSEFAREESAPVPSPPAILVTEAPPPAPPPPQDYPLSRTKSAGGLATKRALELKRKYLLGEPSPPAVRKSDSTSQLDTKLEAFRSNITEFQKMLHPATTPTPQTASPYLSFQFTLDEKKPQPDIPDIIKNLCNDVPVDLLTKGDSPLCNNDWRTPIKEDDKQPDLETDSLSDDSSHTETLPNQSVPRVEVHDEGGELIQLDSLILANNEIDDVDEKISGTATATGTTVVAAESESSESCKDATTLALTETELSDWAAESAVLDDCGMDENTDKKRNKNPRTLSGPKLIHDAKNIAAIATHVCGRNSPPEVVYSNAPEHFEFADEGDQDLSIAAPTTPRNEGYMELVDDDYEPYSTSKDRSINFIERAFSDTTMKSDPNDTLDKITSNLSETLEFIDSPDSKSESILNDIEVVSKLPSTSNTSENGQKADYIENSSSMSNNISKDIEDSSISINDGMNVVQSKIGSVSLSDISPPLVSIDADKNVPIDKSNEDSKDDISPPLASEKGYSIKIVNTPRKIALAPNLRTYSPAICRSASETFSRSNVHVTSSPTQSMNWSLSGNFSSSRLSPETPPVDAVKVDKVQELKREREEQTEVVRRLVLERLGAPKVCRKSTRRNRISPSSCIPPPVPPPPVMAPPSPVLCAPPPPPPPPIYPEVPPRPAPPLMSLSVQSSFSDPELTRQRRPKGFMKSISNYFNKRLGPRHKCVSEPDLTTHQRRDAHTSMGALEAPPVPPPPVCYSPPCESRSPARPSAGPAGVAGAAGAAGAAERDAMQLWFEARWARLVAQRRARGEADEPAARRLARLERRLARPLSAEQQAATVAEIVQVSAQREAHQALMAADRRRNATNSVGD